MSSSSYAICTLTASYTTGVTDSDSVIAFLVSVFRSFVVKEFISCSSQRFEPGTRWWHFLRFWRIYCRTCVATVQTRTCATHTKNVSAGHAFRLPLFLSNFSIETTRMKLFVLICAQGDLFWFFIYDARFARKIELTHVCNCLDITSNGFLSFLFATTEHQRKEARTIIVVPIRCFINNSFTSIATHFRKSNLFCQQWQEPNGPSELPL